jgi:hypothetical protein
VLVDGTATSAYRIVGDSKIELSEVNSLQQHSIEVLYRPAM